MSLKAALVGMTAVAVISDTMLQPFYPQYFAARFGVSDPVHVGVYIAALCLTAMLSLPLWARVARRVPVLLLLVYTQLAAGLLSLGSSVVGTVVEFWLVSLAMIVFKASYLLIYPYIMSLEDKENHAATVGLLSIVVHFGGIAGALAGGSVLQLASPAQVFVAMALGDFVQMAMCAVLLWRGAHRLQTQPEPEAAPGSGGAVWRLGALMLLFYFSEYLIVPFFALYWQQASGLSSALVSGMVFAIPGAMALWALWHNRRVDERGGRRYDGVNACLLLGLAGLLLQASPWLPVLLLGRCLFGWALFQLMVRLDVLLFAISSPQSYAADYSKINICQNVGVLSASFVAGKLVAGSGLAAPFWLAAAGFVATLVAFPLLAPREREGEEVGQQP